MIRIATALLALLPLAAAAPAALARTHTVTIEQLRFNPEKLVVSPGDRIVWVNKDLFPHTVTAVGKAFDSRSIPAQGSWTYRAHRAGEYDYRCSFHPTMGGRLIVR
jgi:plastocyanin